MESIIMQDVKVLHHIICNYNQLQQQKTQNINKTIKVFKKKK